MILDMATSNMDPVSRSIMRSSIGADFLDLDMAGGGAGGQNTFGQNMLKLHQEQQQYQQRQRQQQLLLQQRQQKLLQLQRIQREQQLKQQQRDAANMILAATAIGKAVETQNNAAATNQMTNPYTAAAKKDNKDTVHISLYITSPSATLQQNTRPIINPIRPAQIQTRKPTVNPANSMMNNMMMMQAIKGLELI